MKRLIYLLPIPLAVLLVLGIIHKLRETDKHYTVQERVIKVMVYASGYTRPENYVIVKSEVSGVVKDVYVKEGDFVKRGQVLATIDSSTLREQLRALRERRLLVEERLKEGSPYRKSLEEEIQNLEENVQKLKSYYERRKELYKQGLIPKEQMEEAERSYTAALRSYERAKSSYQDNISALTTERRELLAQEKALQEDIRKYTVRSPTEGYILAKYVNPGDYVNSVSDNRMFEIGDIKKMEVWLDVDEEYMSLLREGQRVFIKLDAFPGKTFEGRLVLVNRSIDKSRRTFRVKVEANLPPDTPANATVEANVFVEEKKALLIPREAYKDGYVLKDEGIRVVRVPVKVGHLVEDRYYEVLEGLKPGDKILLP